MKLSEHLLQESNLEKPLSGTITEQELVFDVFINGDYKRTFPEDGYSLHEYIRNYWLTDELAEVSVKPAYRYYVRLDGAIREVEIKGTLTFD